MSSSERNVTLRGKQSPTPKRRSPPLRSFLKALFHWLVLIGYCYGIYRVSSRTDIKLPDVEGIDRILHAFAYAGLVFVARPAIRTMVPSGIVSLLLAFLLSSAYGASDEWHQSFVRGRAADVGDWYADTIGAGAMMFALLIYDIGRRRRARDETPS